MTILRSRAEGGPPWPDRSGAAPTQSIPVVDRAPRRHRRPVKLREMPLPTIVALLLAIVCPIAAWINARSQTPVYAAEAEVIANGAGEAPNAAQFEAAVGTEQVVLASRAVLEPVAIAHSLDVTDLEDAVEVEAVTGSTVLEVTYENENPQLAVDVLNTIVTTYLGLAPGDVNEQAEELLTGELERLRTERAELEAELDRLGQAAGDTAGTSSNERRLAAESEDLLRRIGAVEQQLNDLALERLEVERSAVVSAPFVLADPVRPKPLQAAALGLVIGVALGGSMLLVRAQLTAIRRESESMSGVGGE